MHGRSVVSFQECRGSNLEAVPDWTFSWGWQYSLGWGNLDHKINSLELVANPAQCFSTTGIQFLYRNPKGKPAKHCLVLDRAWSWSQAEPRGANRGNCPGWLPQNFFLHLFILLLVSFNKARPPWPTENASFICSFVHLFICENIENVSFTNNYMVIYIERKIFKIIENKIIL